MFEVPYAGGNHGDFVFIAGFDDFGVGNGTARLDDSLYCDFCCFK